MSTSPARRQALDAGRPLGRAAYMRRFEGAPETRAAYFRALAERRWRAQRAKRAQGDGSG